MDSYFIDEVSSCVHCYEMHWVYSFTDKGQMLHTGMADAAIKALLSFAEKAKILHLCHSNSNCKMKFNLLKDFKEFAVKGNMIDIAIGVIIGAAFNKVVDVLVKEIFLPPLSFLTDGINWENKKIILRHAATEPGVTRPEEIAIGYGKLIEAGVDFLIIGFTVFMIVKLMHSFREKAEDPKDKTVKTPKDIEILDHIADLMERQLVLMERHGGGLGNELPPRGK